jgi:hypothetical protein
MSLQDHPSFTNAVNKTGRIILIFADEIKGFIESFWPGDFGKVIL